MLHDKFIKIDNSFYDKLKIKEPYITFFKIFTNLASTKLFILICFGLLILKDDKKMGIVLSILMVINAIIIFLLKHIIKRERPHKRQLVYEKGYSYPSGHMVSAISFYGFLLFLTLLSNLIWPIKVIISILLISSIILIGFSRVFLGVHYLSDIMGALFIGLSYELLFIYIACFKFGINVL